jgi:ElaB/YqjD/DUF883 family membrane-anchored ribosome-binding protein
MTERNHDTHIAELKALCKKAEELQKAAAELCQQLTKEIEASAEASLHTSC